MQTMLQLNDIAGPITEPIRRVVPQVGELMTVNPLVLSEEDTLLTMRELMEWKGVRHIPIVNSAGKLSGLMTHRDFLTLAVSKLAQVSPQELDELYSSIRLKDVMGRKIALVTPDTSLSDAAALMLRNKFGCLPVMEGEELVGIITEADFVRAFRQR